MVALVESRQRASFGSMVNNLADLEISFLRLFIIVSLV